MPCWISLHHPQLILRRIHRKIFQNIDMSAFFEKKKHEAEWDNPLGKWYSQ